MVEIDVLPASTDSTGADSILLRFEPVREGGFTVAGQTVILIDGGYAENAATIIEHLKTIYYTDLIDCIVCTHPDADHINGILALIESGEIRVSHLCVHDPWKHAYTISKNIYDNRSTPNSVKNRLDDSLAALQKLLDIAPKNDITVHSLFSGGKIFDALTVLGPSKDYYCELVKQFPGMHEERAYGGTEEYKPYKYNSENGHFISDPTTTAKNDSSYVLLFKYDGFSALFTGDCGAEGIQNALDYADANGISINGIDYLQLPHHGSIKNVNARIFSRISPKKAFVSAPKNSVKHPSRLIMNYLTTVKGINVYHVATNKLRLSQKAPARANWNAATPLSEFPVVYY